MNREEPTKKNERRMMKKNEDEGRKMKERE